MDCVSPDTNDPELLYGYQSHFYIFDQTMSEALSGYRSNYASPGVSIKG
jgi:hypothetical protein